MLHRLATCLHRLARHIDPAPDAPPVVVVKLDERVIAEHVIRHSLKRAARRPSWPGDGGTWGVAPKAE